jgi:hypothetical protein
MAGNYTEIKDAVAGTRARVLTTAPAADDAGLVVRLLGSVAVTVGDVGIKDSSDVRINPSKEDGNLKTVADQGSGNDFTPVAAGTSNVQGLAALANRKLMGFASAETGVTPADAQIILRHGTAATDPIIADIHLGPWESAREGASLFGKTGLKVPNGVFIDRNSVGSSRITLIHRTEV